ncbi:MAG: site-specific integrase [Acutalibacter sp.]|nr:phage integrase SAM-like domain protein [Firmicutes bacterium CAG:94]
MAQTHYKQQINAFAQSLRQEERAQGTIENYLRHLRAFAAWLGGGELTPATAPAWKA